MQSLKEIIETTPELIALGQDYEAIAAWLNHQPVIDNPVPCSDIEVDTPVTIDRLLALMSRREKAAILVLPNLATWLSDSYAEDRVEEHLIDTVSAAFSGAPTGQLPFLAAVTILTEGNQRDVLESLIEILVQRETVSTETALLFAAELAKTEMIPDPDWQPTVIQEPRWITLGLPNRVTPEMVQEVDNAN